MIMSALKIIASKLRALHEDRGGATMMEYILVFAAVALPLLAVIIWFYEDISQWAGELWESAKTGQSTDPSTLGDDG